MLEPSFSIMDKAIPVQAVSRKLSPMQSILAYLGVFFLIVITRGNLLYTLNHPKIFIILFLLVAFTLRLGRNRIRWDNSVFYIIGLVLLMSITSFYNGTFDSDFYFFILYAFITFIFIGSLTFREFKSFFLNIVCLLSLISIIIFSASQVVSLPLNIVESEYVKVGYYMFHTIEWNDEPLGRNAGLFSEPGCFQYCLNYCLLLYIDDIINKEIDKKNLIKLLVVVIAIVTCASTTGYLVLMALSVYILYRRRSRNILKLMFIIIPVFSAILYFLFISDTVQGKLNDETNPSVIMRTADAIATAQMISDHPFIGNGGVETDKYKKKVIGYGALTADHGASNGVLVGMAVLGVGWLFLYCSFCYKASRKLFKDIPPIIIVLLTLLIHTNEYFIFSPIVYIFIFPYKKTTVIIKKQGVNLINKFS